MNTRASRLLAALLAAALAISGDARAKLIATDEFFVDAPSGYALDRLWGQNPTVAGFTGAWTEHQSTGTVNVVSAGLTYPGLLPAFNKTRRNTRS